MKTLVCFLLAGAVAIFSTLPLATAQVANGARRGFTVTDEQSHRLFRINLDDASMTIQRGDSGVPQELEGLYSFDGETTSSLRGVGENPDGTGAPPTEKSNCVDLSGPAVNDNLSGIELAETGVEYGTEVGAAWDHINMDGYAIFSDDRTIGDDFPATRLYKFNNTSGDCDQGASLVNESVGLYLDGLAVGGDGTLYATDARLSDSLYRFDPNADADGEWVQIGLLDPTQTEDFGEDSGLANYRGEGGNETNLYVILEGEGVGRLGRLFKVCHADNASFPPCTAGQATLVGNITISGTEVPEDLEGFDIPWKPLSNE
jgi:hypothetical protein